MKLNEAHHENLQAMIRCVETLYNNPLPQDDRVMLATKSLMNDAINGKIEPFQFAEKLSSVFKLVGVPVKVDWNYSSEDKHYSFTLESL